MKTSIVILLLLALSGQIQAGEWPKLKDRQQEPLCDKALEIARAAFQSSSPTLAIDIPADSKSMILVGPSPLGSGAPYFNEALVERLPVIIQNRQPNNLYWQKTATLGRRIVVSEMNVNWQGEDYRLFSIGENISRKELLAEAHGAQDYSKLKIAPSVTGGWQVPVVLQEKQIQQAWAIDTGPPKVFLGDWRVFVQNADGLKHQCSLQFRPPVKSAAMLLPQEVRDLSRLLVQAIGHNPYEGSLDPWQNLHVSVQRKLANVALRPWALGEPYNDRATVDQELTAWSKRGANKALRERILAQYPRAEKALAQHYRKNLAYPEKKAKAEAATALDNLFRSQFVFSKN